MNKECSVCLKDKVQEETGGKTKLTNISCLHRYSTRVLKNPTLTNDHFIKKRQ